MRSTLVIVVVAAACGGGKVVVEPPPPEPHVDRVAAHDAAAKRRAAKRRLCRRLMGVADGAIRTLDFEAAGRSVTELERHRCPSAQTGALATKLALAVREQLMRTPTTTDKRWVEREAPACAGRSSQCGVELRSHCPRPKQPLTYSKKAVAYTRVALSLLRKPSARQLNRWLAAQACVAHNLGVTEASQFAESEASSWRDANNRDALRACLKSCRLTPAARARLVELGRTWPTTATATTTTTTANPERLDPVVNELLAVNARARRLLRRRRFDAGAARALRARGNALVRKGRRLINGGKQHYRVVRRFRYARSSWQRRERRLRRRLRRR